MDKEPTNGISLVIEAAHIAYKSESFKQAAQQIFNLCKKITGAKAGYVALLSKDKTRNEVLFLDSGGLSCSVNPNLQMPVRGLRAEAYQTGRPIFENDFSNSKWNSLLPEGHVLLQNVLFVPMILEGEVIGLLGLANKSGKFNEKDVEWTAILAEIAAIALHNTHLLETLEKSEKRFREAFNQAQLYQNILIHDIYNILQIVLTAVEYSNKILSDRNNSKNRIKLKEMLDIIHRQYERGIRVISNVQKLSMLGENESTIQRIEINKLLQQAIHNMNTSFQTRNIQIETELPQELFYTYANMILLDVFENLLYNAIKYNRNEKIQITIKGSREIRNGTSYIKLEFLDNGVGISEKQKRKLFQTQVERENRGTGLGIGLILVKKAIENYKGKIYVENRIKKDYTQGSNFVVLLPEA
ncbi:MAG: sensor histidine kinase [Candidatus Helarchaeota archaeon]